MSNSATTEAKIQSAMRLAHQLVGDMSRNSDAAFLASMKGFMSHMHGDPFLKTISGDLAANRKINFADWYAKALANHKYEPPALRPDEAAILFALFDKIDQRQISVTDFMLEVDGLMRMHKCYAEFTAKYVLKFMGYLDWVIQEKQYHASKIGLAVGEEPSRGPDLFPITLQKPVFEKLLESLRRAISQGLAADDQVLALEELTLIARGFNGEASPTEVSSATSRLVKKYDYFRTRLQDFTSGASLLHLPEDLPPFVKALQDGLKS